MPKRKLVNIGIPPKLPTIAEFFGDMADRQGEEIRRLKQERLEASALPNPKRPVKQQRKVAKAKSAGEVTPYPWLLHPVRKRTVRKRRG